MTISDLSQQPPPVCDAYRPRAMRWPLLRLDPRSVFLVLIGVNISAFTSSSAHIVVFAIIVTTVFVFSTARLKTASGWLIATVIFVVLWTVLPSVWHSNASALLSYAGYWFVRFSVVAGWGIYAVSTLRIPEVAAVFTRMRAPVWLHLPVLVMIRFFPVAIAELRAISDAMVLRGLKPGVGGFMTHPLRTGELLMIPFLASSARIADELAAAALIKGVGTTRERTTTVETPFRTGDAIAITIVAILAIWRIVEIL
ncbi:MAG: energy-coupling factor transporter transmembrane component T [Actinomycetaceae bacterium]|nr:energy-coupling factor transporter transmembrane component T [Actinomycetaceae bacterium]